MKKILLSFCSIILVLTLALSGCSCAPTTPLSFNNNFAGESGADNSFSTETLTYKIEYVQSYSSTLEMDSRLNSELVPKYENGKCVTKFEYDVGRLPDGIQTDINYSDSQIHHLTNQMDIDVTVNSTTYHDKILTEVFFYSSGYAFAPIYSKTTLKNTMISISATDNTVTETVAIYQYETSYNLANYKMSKKAYSVDIKGLSEKEARIQSNTILKDVDITNLDQTKLTDMEEIKTFDYSIKTCIDNTQLLFAMRNLSIKEEQSSSLPTISPTYGQAKDISVTNNSESVKDVAITYNGTPYGSQVEPAKIPVQNLSFVIGGTNNIGTAQHVVIQKSKSESFPYFRALPLEYTETLIEYSNFSLMGALQYTLTEVTVA